MTHARTRGSRLLLTLAGVGMSALLLAARCPSERPPPAPPMTQPDAAPVARTVASPPVARSAAPSPPHPRLLLTPDILRRVRAKAKRNDPSWIALQRFADRLSSFTVAAYHRHARPRDAIVYDYQGYGWLEAATVLGLAYQVTGDREYAQKVLELLRAVNAPAAVSNVEPISADRGYPSRSAALAVALAFDWVYPELDAQTRAATVVTLNRWFDWYAATANDRDGPAVSNYFGGHLLGFGAAGVATAGDNARADEIVAHVRKLFDAVVAPSFASGGPFAGGFPVEGYGYGTAHFVRLLEFLEFDAASRASIGTREVADRLARNLAHAVGPGGWRVPVEADYAGDTTGVLDLGLPLVLAHLLAGSPAGACMQHLIAKHGTPPHGLTTGASDLDWLLYWDSSRPALNCAEVEPLFFHSAGDEHLFMRSSWSRGAVWASFNAGLTILSDHQARVAGHFAVQRGDDALLIYAGQWKGDDGLTGQPQQFQTTSAYANTLFVDDGGAYLYSGERYLGGQGLWAKTRPFPFHQDADSTWAKLDATPIYDRKPEPHDKGARSVRLFVRNFLYLRPETFVVFDRVRMGNAGYAKHLRVHLGGRDEPRLNGTSVSARIGESALHLRVLLPRDPAIHVAWNTVQNGVKLSPRLEVGASTPSTDLDVLTVLSAQDRRASAPEAELVIADGGVMVGAHVRASSDPPRTKAAGDDSASAVTERVALFGEAPTAMLPASAVVRYRVILTGPSRHHLFDLEPGRTYLVRAAAVGEAPGAMEIVVSPASGAPGAPGASIRSSEVGSLVFDIVAGEVHPVSPVR